MFLSAFVPDHNSSPRYRQVPPSHDTEKSSRRQAHCRQPRLAPELKHALSPKETLPPLAAKTAIFAIVFVMAPAMPGFRVESIVTARRARRVSLLLLLPACAGYPLIFRRCQGILADSTAKATSTPPRTFTASPDNGGFEAQPRAIGYQPSAVSRQPSAVSGQRRT